MFICLLPPQVLTRYHKFRSVSMRLDHAVACIRDFIRKFFVVYRPLLHVLVASVFKAEEDGCYIFFACTCMCLIFLSIALCTLSKSTIQNRKVN